MHERRIRLEPDLVAITSRLSIEELVKDDVALRSALTTPGQGACRVADTPATRQVLQRLGVYTDGRGFDAQWVQDLALCITHTLETTVAVELRSDLVFETIAGEKDKGRLPFWMPFSFGGRARQSRYDTDPHIALALMAGLSFAVAGWLERDAGRNLSPAMWVFVTHAEDVMTACEREVTGSGAVLRQVAKSVLARTVARYMPIKEVLAHLDDIADDAFGLRLKARAAAVVETLAGGASWPRRGCSCAKCPTIRDLAIIAHHSNVPA